MRRVLVDHARGKARGKRRGAKVTLEEAIAGAEDPGIDVLELHDALERLAEHDERQARIVELHYFGGLSREEVGEVFDVSPSTVVRDLRRARAWLYTALRPGS